VRRKLNNKLIVNRETLRHLSAQELDAMNGGGTTATTIRSTPTDSCASQCFGCNTLLSNCCP